MYEYRFNVGDIVRVKHFDEIIPTENSTYQTQSSKEIGEYFGVRRDSINRTADESDYYIIDRRIKLFDSPAYVLHSDDHRLIPQYYVADEMLEYFEPGFAEAETDIAPINETDFLNYLFG